jgi:phosphatidylinositol glycan class A protein
MQPGLKVYYLPILPIASDATLPQYLLNLPLLRNILLREKVQILHGHATLSSMALEGLMQAPFFRTRHVNAETQEVTYKAIRTVFTDHSLFGFGDAVGVLTNKLLAGALRNIDAVVCVSHAGSVPPPRAA